MNDAVDFGWGRPGGVALAAAGVRVVCRYLSYDASKNLDAAEVADYHARGIGIVPNWEARGDWSEFSSGYAGGQRAGGVAGALLGSLGAPLSVPVVCSYDTQAYATQWPTIEQWLSGFAAGSGRRVWFYGQGNLGDWLLSRGVAWLWQTNASGWGGISTRAVLYQHFGGTIGGVQVDWDTIAGDPHEWAWMPETQETDEMTPAQAEQLAQAADQARKAAWSAAGARDVGLAAMSWLAHGGVDAGLAEIYAARLGRAVDPSGARAWRERVAVGWSWGRVDAAVAASAEARRVVS